jgi:hypothetical protein
MYVITVGPKLRLFSAQDGSCIWYDFGSNERVVLTGSDVDPIFSISSDGRHVFTGARDGNVRKYDLQLVFG